MSKTVFDFLVKEYGYKLEKTEKVGFGYYSRFINETSKTKVEIWFDIRDRWQDCTISHYFTNTNEYMDTIRFYKLQALIAPNAKVNYGSANEEEAYLQFADVLKKYGQDVLRGDFSQLHK
ncbi:MAG: hypothetical protein PHD29_04680 [bacterium]|nr:hypothetical protein [bacterium]MDD5756245.1 hypothetical protein [bacterium]